MKNELKKTQTKLDYNYEWINNVDITQEQNFILGPQIKNERGIIKRVFKMRMAKHELASSLLLTFL